ncbi:MAG: hypothetical protein KJ734_06390, partial [Chloroflexi bacterium]|nr:hypothetical protein [Chloroflexota bacterium]
MPELPEVEILRRELQAQAVGRTVADVCLTGRRPGSFTQTDARAVLVNRPLVAVRRRGKLLVLDFDGGHSLIVHLMMVGQFLLSPPFASEPRDVALTLQFIDGTMLTLGQVDLQYVHLLPTKHVDAWPATQSSLGLVARLGVDPTGPHFTVEALAGLLHGRRGALKLLLMNQSVIAGLGNTYVDEILFNARLSPTRVAGSLS